MDILLRSATEKIDESPAGRLVEGVLAAVNEYDNELRRERAKISLWRRIEQGLFPWRPPIGYMVDPQRPPSEKLTPHVPDPTCDLIVIDIFEQFSTGTISKEMLSKPLTHREIVDSHGRRIKFANQTIDNILSNIYYTGWLKHRDGRLIKGHHKELITMELFQKCQDVKNGRSNNTAKPRLYMNPNFPLRQFVLCGECEQGLTGTLAKKKYAHYFCYNPDCKMFRKTVRKSTLENDFGAYLANIKPTDEMIQLFEESFIRRYKAREREIRGDYLRKVDELKQLEADKEWVIQQGRKEIFTP